MLLRKAPVLNTILASLLAGALVACGSGSSSSTSSSQPVYTTVFDAGSSGTRLSFFKVTPGNGGYPQITKLYEKEYDDNGINDFLNGVGTITLVKKGVNILPDGKRPVNCTGGTVVITADETIIEGLGQTDVSPCVIEPLLLAQDATLASNKLSRAQVKTELFATAGMRTEEKFNGGTFTASQISEYYGRMKTYVASMGFGTGEFKTINGNKEEGVWTWINLNDQYYNAFGGNTAYCGTNCTPTTVGDFEVGGSSMQIAFPTKTLPVGDTNNVYSVTINGYTYNVFSKTFLGLGGDDARKYMRSYGYNTRVTTYNTGLECFASNATSSSTKEDSGVTLFYNFLFFPNSTTISTNAVDNTWSPTLSNTQTPLLLGNNPSYSYNGCAVKYADVSDAIIALPRNNYGTIPNQITPASYSNFASKVAQSSSPFVGLDNFFYTAKDLGLAVDTQVTNNFTSQQFYQALAGSSSKCVTGSVSATSIKGGSAVCANGTFMNDFLWRANGGLFAQGTPSAFKGVVPTRLNGVTTLTWTRGYLLQKYANAAN